MRKTITSNGLKLSVLVSNRTHFLCMTPDRKAFGVYARSKNRDSIVTCTDFAFRLCPKLWQYFSLGEKAEALKRLKATR